MKTERKYLKEAGRYFYTPFLDLTNKIVLMYYANNCLSYGIDKTGLFFLCWSGLLEGNIKEIISGPYKTFAEVQEEFYKEKSKIIRY